RPAEPAWNFGTAGVGKTGEIAIINDWHNARINRLINTSFMALLHKIKIGIRIEKILRDAAIGTCVKFTLQITNIIAVAFGLRMNFRISSNFQMEVIAEMFPDKCHQLVGIHQLIRTAYTGGHITT